MTPISRLMALVFGFGFPRIRPGAKNLNAVSLVEGTWKVSGGGVEGGGGSEGRIDMRKRSQLLKVGANASHQGVFLILSPALGDF